VASTRQVATVLGADHTRSLLHELPERYKTQINDVLLTALAVAFQGWTRTPSLLVDLEGHGREEVGEGLDVSRTVGWFTTLFPVLLDLEAASGALAVLKTVKERLRAIPAHGIGYGLLRYVRKDEDTARKLRELPQAEVSFLYLGRLDVMAAVPGPFRTAEESSGIWRSPRDRRRHLLEISAQVTGGRLHVSWTYSENIHDRSTVEELAQSFLGTLRALVSHPETLAAKAHISSDFPAARLDQRELEEFLSSVKRSGSVDAR
jgi:non-ribosomal peptide synthase protein (TIGR01720 family)